MWLYCECIGFLLFKLRQLSQKIQSIFSVWNLLTWKTSLINALQFELLRVFFCILQFEWWAMHKQHAHCHCEWCLWIWMCFCSLKLSFSKFCGNFCDSESFVIFIQMPSFILKPRKMKIFSRVVCFASLFFIFCTQYCKYYSFNSLF